MTFQKFSILMTIGASTLALGACSIGHPNAIPTGYTHHHQEYKSATPAPSAKVTDKQRVHMDVMQAEQFRNAVYNLLSRLTTRAGMPPKPVFVLSPDPMTPFYARIDNDLRESMRAIGYAISDRPEGAYVFTYSADAIDVPRGMEQSGQPNVELILKVFNEADPQARQLTQEIGRYFIKGAEDLNIHPTIYADLPNYKSIRHQMQGFDTFAAPRTPAGDLNTPLNEGSNPMPVTPTVRMPQPMADPLPTTAPLQPAMVDSGSVSYAEPLVEDYSPTIPRSRVSREIDY